MHRYVGYLNRRPYLWFVGIEDRIIEPAAELGEIRRGSTRSFRSNRWPPFGAGQSGLLWSRTCQVILATLTARTSPRQSEKARW